MEWKKEERREIQNQNKIDNNKKKEKKEIAKEKIQKINGLITSSFILILF